MITAPYQPRQFVPADIDLTDTSALEPVFLELGDKLIAARTAADLEAWLDLHGEVCAALGQGSSIAYIRMTCQTDDEEREAVFMKWVEEIDPWTKPRQFALLKALSEHPAFADLPQEYEVFRRGVLMAVRLYREENIPRQVEEAKLSQQYQKITGAMTVEFDGKEQTIAQMGKVLEEPDRERRQRSWELVTARRAQDREALEEIFDKMLGLRREIAQAADFEDYRAYAFAAYERFDYTPEDCLRFHDAIEEHVVPLARELQRQRKEKLGIDVLKPWDLAVDPENRPPLQPFETTDEFVSKTSGIFHKLDDRLASSFQVLRDGDLLDLENRKGKAPGGYQSTLSEARVPFIFMNAVGLHRDLETLVHEAGHAFHALAARDKRLYAYRGAPIEFCEVASMAMELLTAPLWSEFYNEDDTRRARRQHLEGIIKFFPWMAQVDAFQHWLYTHPGHSRDERRAHWLALHERFGGDEDYSGFEDALAHTWHRQLHIFEIPFYYVEYGIAQLGALQLWRNAQADRAAAIDAYLNGLALGGSRPLPELFAGANIRFDFSAQTIAPLMSAVRDELAALEG